jgi:hypothetical protein
MADRISSRTTLSYIATALRDRVERVDRLDEYLFDDDRTVARRAYVVYTRWRGADDGRRLSVGKDLGARYPSFSWQWDEEKGAYVGEGAVEIMPPEHWM